MCAGRDVPGHGMCRRSTHVCDPMDALKTRCEVRLARIVQWFDRNEDGAVESWNEACLFVTEHLPHFIGAMG